MNRVHLMVLWHMHQPQYAIPATGQYVLPWTRAARLKDYWGWFECWMEFPRVHRPSMWCPRSGCNSKEYASGHFDEPWFATAFRPAKELTPDDKSEILTRAFQLNYDHFAGALARIQSNSINGVCAQGNEARPAKVSASATGATFNCFSQLAWMDEEYLGGDPVVSRLARLGTDYTEQTSKIFAAKQIDSSDACCRVPARRFHGTG